MRKSLKADIRPIKPNAFRCFDLIQTLAYLINRALILPLLTLFPLGTWSHSLDMGYEIEFELCFKKDDPRAAEAHISLVDPGDGSIQSGTLYWRMGKSIDNHIVYPESYLVHSGGTHFITLEHEENHILAWEFRVRRLFKTTDWSSWLPATEEFVSEDADLYLLIGTNEKHTAPKEDNVWLRYRIVKYELHAPYGETPMCPGDTG